MFSLQIQLNFKHSNTPQGTTKMKILLYKHNEPNKKIKLKFYCPSVLLIST